jgi:hypothetical protein
MVEQRPPPRSRLLSSCSNGRRLRRSHIVDINRHHPCTGRWPRLLMRHLVLNRPSTVAISEGGEYSQ